MADCMLEYRGHAGAFEHELLDADFLEQGFGECMDAGDEMGRHIVTVTAQQAWDTMSHPISSSVTGSPSSPGDPGLQDSYMINSSEPDPLAATSARMQCNSFPCLPADCESPPSTFSQNPVLAPLDAHEHPQDQQTVQAQQPHAFLQLLQQEPPITTRAGLHSPAAASASTPRLDSYASLPTLGGPFPRAFPHPQPLSMAMLMQATQSACGLGAQLVPSPTFMASRSSNPGNLCRSASSTIPRGPIVPMSASFVPAPSSIRPGGMAAPRVPPSAAAGPAEFNRQKRKSIDISRRAAGPASSAATAAGSSGISRSSCGGVSSGTSAAAAAAQASSLFSNSMAGMMAGLGMNPMAGMGLGGPMGFPGMPGLGGMMGFGGMPGMSGLGAMGGMAGMPSMAGMPGMPSMGGMPGMPGMGGMPGMPGMGGMPGMSSMGGMPGMPSMGGLPGMPSMGGMPGMAGMGGIPGMGGMMGLPSFLQPPLPSGTVWGTPMNPQAQAPGICPPALPEPTQPVPLWGLMPWGPSGSAASMPGMLRTASSLTPSSVPTITAPASASLPSPTHPSNTSPLPSLMTIFPPISTPSHSGEQLAIARMSNHSHHASSRRPSLTKSHPHSPAQHVAPPVAAAATAPLPLSMASLLAISASSDSSRRSFSGDRSTDGVTAAAGISALCADLLGIPPRRGSAAAAAASQQCSLLSGSEQMLCNALSEDCDMFGFSGEHDESRKMPRCESQLYLPSLEDLMEPEEDESDEDREQRMMGFTSHHQQQQPSDISFSPFPPIPRGSDGVRRSGGLALAGGNRCSNESSNTHHRVRFSDSMQCLSIADDEPSDLVGGCGSAASMAHRVSMGEFHQSSRPVGQQQQTLLPPQQQQPPHMLSSLYDMGSKNTSSSRLFDLGTSMSSGRLFDMGFGASSTLQQQFPGILPHENEFRDSFDIGVDGDVPGLDDICGSVGEHYLRRDDSFLDLSMHKCDSLLHMIGSTVDLQGAV